MKAVLLIGYKVVGKVTANRTGIGSERKLGAGPQEKFFKATPSRTSENALLESRI